MSRSQQRRVDRLSKLAGPCSNCRDREDQEMEMGLTLVRLREKIAVFRAQHDDPSWLQAEAVRLEDRANEFERNNGENDSLRTGQDGMDGRQAPSADGTQPNRIVEPAERCLRCQESSGLLPSPEIVRLATRVHENCQRKNSDPEWLREQARDLEKRAEALKGREERIP